MSQPLGAYLRVGGHRIEHEVLAGIQDASRKTGVDFAYLMAQAEGESAFDASARSRRSSASGLYQFTSSTWLELMKRHGADHGQGALTAAIRRDRQDGYVVDDPATRKRILDLRRDPSLSAVMAGEYANENRAKLERRLGRKATGTDLYLAHFFGPAGAVRFLKAHAANPKRAAAAVMPDAVPPNRPLFLRHGQPASLDLVYRRIRTIVEAPQRHYTHLEKVSAWAAPWTENISTEPQFASAEPLSFDDLDDAELANGEVEDWVRDWGDSLEQPAPQPSAAPVTDVVTLMTDGLSAPQTTAAAAAARLAKVNATGARDTMPADAAAEETPPVSEVGRNFHSFWRSLLGRSEV